MFRSVSVSALGLRSALSPSDYRLGGKRLHLSSRPGWPGNARSSPSGWFCIVFAVLAWASPVQ